jgi:hypothetical protein
VGHFDDHGRLFVEGRDDYMIVSGAEPEARLEGSAEGILSRRGC